MFLKLERTGSTIVGSTSNDGVSWQPVGQATLASATATAGLVVTSHDPALLNTSTFDQVALVP